MNSTFVNIILCPAAGVTLLLFFIVPTFKHFFGHDREVEDADQELCKSCGYDVRNLLTCPECGNPTPSARRQSLAKLREAWPTEVIQPRQPDAGESSTLVLTTDDGTAVRLLREHLEARGIAAKVNMVEKTNGAVYSQAKKSYRLTVWSEDEERSRAIVEHLWPEEMRT